MSQPFHTALRAFWMGRDVQADRQRVAGRVDAGLRGAVTGGGHLDALRDLIADVFVAAGVPEHHVFRNSGIALPGFSPAS